MVTEVLLPLRVPVSFLREEVSTSQPMKEEMKQVLHLGARDWAGYGLPCRREGKVGNERDSGQVDDGGA